MASPNPTDEPPSSQVNQYIVSRRVRTLFETTSATRTFSTGACAKHLLRKANWRENQPMGELKTVTSTEAQDGVQQQELQTMLGDLSFRFNEVCEISTVEEKPSGESTESRSKRSSVKLPETKSNPKVKLSASQWRSTTKLADPILGDDNFLTKLQLRLQKESINSLRERLEERKVKDADTKEWPAVRPKAIESHRSKNRKRKEAAELDPLYDDSYTLPHPMTTHKLRSKLATLHSFKSPP